MLCLKIISVNDSLQIKWYLGAPVINKNDIFIKHRITMQSFTIYHSVTIIPVNGIIRMKINHPKMVINSSYKKCDNMIK